MTMRALRFHKTGDLAGLKVEEVPMPSPGPGELLVRVRTAAINPSDVKNVQGKMHQTTVPRTPRRDFAGVVEAGSQELESEEVFGTGGDLGFIREGSHADLEPIPVGSITPCFPGSNPPTGLGA
jgi:NADPH:quinone reductase-like Zn-dependent oxidoreductase